MATTQRRYNHKDVDMLITAATIVETAIANKTFLQSKRSAWNDSFFTTLKNRIDNATKQYLGIDGALKMREATLIVNNLQKTALIELAELKVQVNEDFKVNKPRRTEILKQLGFTAYHAQAQRGDQEALINLLFQYVTNLTPALTAEIVTAGTSADLLADLTTYANDLKIADINQETFKGTKKTLTAAAVKEFNDIYDQVISISKIAGKFYKDQQDKKDQFSYSKVSKALNFKVKTAGAVKTTT